MSCNYADGLSPYENKGILGLPEKFDTIEKFNAKCKLLAQMIDKSNHVVVHTGAGISTSAGIPDFRGPNGVWTLEREGKRPNIDVSFADAKPTKTHMILRKLVDCNKVHFVVSQNIDGLHLKSGLPRKYLAELHGNMFVDECNVCKGQFVRSSQVETVGKKSSGVSCLGRRGGRGCRGKLHDAVLDWEHSLPDNDLYMAETHSCIADLSICLGTTLQIVPSGNLPLETLKYGGQLVICNLQPTKHDNKADLIINYYVDEVLTKVMEILKIDIPEYNVQDNPMILAKDTIVDWTIDRKDVLALEKIFKSKCKGVKKKRIIVKTKLRITADDDDDFKPKIRKIDSENTSTVCKLEKSIDLTEPVQKLVKLRSQLVDDLNITESKTSIDNENKKDEAKIETGDIEPENVLKASAENKNGDIALADPDIKKIVEIKTLFVDDVNKTENEHQNDEINIPITETEHALKEEANLENTNGKPQKETTSDLCE